MAGDEGLALPETAKRQVSEVVPVLPFGDEPATFVLVMLELAEALALDDEE
jgi:hypothetical protein